MANKTNNENFLDAPVPKINVKVLTPQPATSYFERLSKYASDKRESVKKYAKNKWNRWVDWFLNYIPFEVIKNILKLYKPFESSCSFR